nr:DNA helicase [Tanacetum cinerariifolium]
MGLRDAEYFDQLLQLRQAYRFTGFSCEPTDKWERTLPTETSLIFGGYLQAEEIPSTDFPEHYFNFAAYNELQDRLSARLHWPHKKNWKRQHNWLPLWNEMAINLDERGYNLMEKPVVIAASSCYINHYHGLQLSGTSATHYYLNPNIPKTSQIKQMVFPTVTLALPPPEPIETPIPYITDELQQTPTELPTVSKTMQIPQQHYEKESEQPSISEETFLTQPSKPETTTPPITKPAVPESRAEIPANRDPMGKKGTEKKLPNPSVKKVLLQDPPEIQAPQATKKQKNEPANK